MCSLTLFTINLENPLRINGMEIKDANYLSEREFKADGEAQ